MIGHHEDAAEDIEIAFDHLFSRRDVNIVLGAVRAVIHPGEQRAAHLLILTFEFGDDRVLVFIPEYREVMFDDPAERVLNGERRAVGILDFAPEQLVGSLDRIVGAGIARFRR